MAPSWWVTALKFTPLWLYQGEERAGSIAYNTFEVYPDVSPHRIWALSWRMT